MDKISIKQYATAEYNRQSYNNVLQAVEQQINRAADGYLYPTTSVSAAYTATLNDAIILADGTFTVTLPAADQCKNKRFTVKNIGTGTITVAAATGNIDGVATVTLSITMQSIDFVCDGSNFWMT